VEDAADGAAELLERGAGARRLRRRWSVSGGGGGGGGGAAAVGHEQRVQPLHVHEVRQRLGPAKILIAAS